MFSKKTVKDINLKGKRVLLRVDYNVPISDGKITDDYRIVKSLPTIQYILKEGASLIICSHLGRPDGKVNPSESLSPIADMLHKKLGRQVSFVSDIIGDEATNASKDLKPGQIILLENLRFYSEEENNDKGFAKKLARLADVLVQDAFGVSHRAHASLDAITEFLPSVAGLLLEKEVVALTSAMESPEKPLMAIVGGAKISDKVSIINRLIDIADIVVVGGAMANTFLAAEGVDVAKSLVEKDAIPIAKDILEKVKHKSSKQSFVFYLPQDSVVANKIDKSAKTRIVDWYEHRLADIESYPKRAPRSATELNKDDMILDIGPCAGSFMAGAIQLAKTVIWNGTMGVTETPSIQGAVGPFSHGTDLIVEAMLGRFGNKPYTVVGGGDTVGYVENCGLVEEFGHVSTGGGASLELMAGQKLPAVEALEDK